MWAEEELEVFKVEVSNCSVVSQKSVSSQLASTWSVEQSGMWSPFLERDKCKCVVVGSALNLAHVVCCTLSNRTTS